ncbi:MAG: hypothetical protein ACRC9H_06405, partial [Aeromonas veronii]
GDGYACARGDILDSGHLCLLTVKGGTLADFPNKGLVLTSSATELSMPANLGAHFCLRKWIVVKMGAPSE